MRLVAYHNFKTERESLELGRDYRDLVEKAKLQDPVKYNNHHLVIEDDNGCTVSSFVIKDNKFTQVSLTD